MWPSTPSRRTPVRRKQPSSAKRARSVNVLARNDVYVLEVMSSSPALVRQTLIENRHSLSAHVFASGHAILISPTRLMLWHTFRPEERCVAFSLTKHTVNALAAQCVSIGLPNNEIESSALDEGECSVASLTYITACGTVYCFDLDKDRPSSSNNNTFYHLCRTSVSLSSGESVQSATALSDTRMLFGTSCARIGVINVSKEELEATLSFSFLDPSRPLLSRLIGFGSGSAPVLALQRADEHGLLLSLNAARVDAFRFIESELVQCWSADQVLDAVSELFRTNPSAERLHLINMKCLRSRVSIVAGAFTTAGLELCLCLYELSATGLRLVQAPKPLSLPPEWGVAQDADSIQVEMSEQDESLVFVFNRLFLFFYDSTNDVADSLAFDSLVLGGGRCANQRGAFLLHERHGVICARLVRHGRVSPPRIGSGLVSALDSACLAPPPSFPAPAEAEAAAAAEPDEAMQAQLRLLFDAFVAFQHARIANCRTLAGKLLRSSELASLVSRASRRIVDAQLPSSTALQTPSPLHEKQARHTAFVEFLKAMPFVQESIWQRVPIETRHEVVEHARNLEVASAVLHLFHLSVSQFPQLVPGFENAFEKSRREILQGLMSAAVQKRGHQGLIGEGPRVEDIFFCGVSSFEEVLPLLLRELLHPSTVEAREAVTVDHLLKLFFVLRSFRVILGLAARLRDANSGAFDDGDHEASDVDVEHVLRSWTLSARVHSVTQELLQELLRVLRVLQRRDASEMDESASQPLRADVLYRELCYLSSLLLNAFVSEKNALQKILADQGDDGGGVATRLASVTKLFVEQRGLLSSGLINLAPDHTEPTKRYALAFEFAEDFDDCGALFQLCEMCDDQARAARYVTEFGDEFALAKFNALYSKRLYQRLLDVRGAERDCLHTFVSTKPRLLWVHELDEGRLESAAEHLGRLATDPMQVPSLHERKLLCALTKLMELGAGASSSKLKQMNGSIAVLEAQEALGLDDERVLSKAELINALLRVAVSTALDSASEPLRWRRLERSSSFLCRASTVLGLSVGERERPANLALFFDVCKAAVEAEYNTLQSLLTQLQCESGTSAHVARALGLDGTLLYQALHHCMEALESCAPSEDACGRSEAATTVVQFFNEFVLSKDADEKLAPLLKTMVQFASSNLAMVEGSSEASEH